MSREQIVLREKKSRVTLDELLPFAPGIACDFYVHDIERLGERKPSGYRAGTIENIDHHADHPDFEREVSSANLAIQRVRASGTAHANQTVIINHTDCDSILSSAIIAGALEPAPRYGEAAIAADHTGEANDIADLLQAIDFTGIYDVDFSLRALAALEGGHQLHPAAAHALAARNTLRAEAARAVQGEMFRWCDGVAWAQFDQKIDGEFFPSLLPEATLIVIGYPSDKDRSKTIIKARLGRAAPKSTSLKRLEIETFDSAWGGRWNAGSNSRGGGTTMPVGEWARRLAGQISNRAGLAKEG